MNQRLKILHIEDIQSDAELIDRILRRSGVTFEKLVVDTKEEYVKALDEFVPDIVLSDHSLPMFNSLEALRILKVTGRNIPFILITATVSEEFAVNVMKEGASDYVLKDRLQRLPSAVANAVDKHRSESDRKMHLNKIMASEALFTKAELLAEFGTWRADIATNAITWSAGTYKLLGYENGEIKASYENFIRNVHPDDLSKVKGHFENTTGTFRPTGSDYRIINKDGSIRYLHTLFEFEQDENGKPEYIIGFIQDVTRSKLAQLEIEKHIEELKAANDRQSDILDALPLNMVLLDESGRIVAVNESWKQFTIANNPGVPGYGIGFSYTTISEKATGVDVTTAQKIVRGIKEVVEGEIDRFSMEYSYPARGQKAWFQLIVARLTNKAKKGAAVQQINITDRKQAEEKLKALNIELEKNVKQLMISNAELEQFAYVASHDLQEPLRMITSFMALLEKKYEDIVDDKGKLYIHFAVDGAKRMRNIVLDLLEYSRAGQTEDTFEQVDFNKLVIEVMALYRKNIQELDATIVFENLPTFKTYKTPLRQVFQNLMDNGLKYHQPDRRPLIIISCIEERTYYQFSVKDNGIGIDAEYFDKIFIIFQRLHNKTEYSGTGMGLAITKKVIENLGGKIWLESEEGKGTTFHFTVLKGHKL